ncbi:DUF1254 domain-containing protein [Curtobacterium flaccumfaciens]|uniref:DUF1254 domain-containing protein n=1 Tax=Curtobacterium flaccumfaciens TaxID=2035 RepID=UPI001BDF057C|nr:DUF1254 domain-containing protein [Curtobacterium flaccumfaciens]MBT1671716.1 DUF1254 domain-containing protein [Curtobacterium flaccumfaciens pv. flaccumfaciens]
MTEVNYRFPGGYPDESTIQAAYDAADLNRAIQCYKHFFPLVSGASIFVGQAAVGVRINEVFGFMDTRPAQAGLTLNSDTPYGGPLLDLHVGPLVVEIPAGLIVGAILNYDQSWITDVGIPGPDAGKGGSYLLLPPGYEGEVPEGSYVVAQAESFKVLVGLRGIPRDGDVPTAIALLQTVTITPLDPDTPWTQPTWIDMSGAPQDTSPCAVEGSIGYWELLHAALQDEPPRVRDVTHESELAVLGITREQPFEPDERMRAVLERAAVEADAQMRVQSFADRRPDRVAWSDRQWEWVSLRPDNVFFQIEGRTDVIAKDTWFYQAIASSPAMFRRVAGGGSVYWFGAHDSTGAYLDGARDYTLSIPTPVPAGLFWSVTVYDATTRSQIDTDQGNAALRSIFELADSIAGDSIELRFGPEPPEDGPDRWVKTIPGRGWFVYLRLYGPTSGAFDGSWTPGDFVAR